MSSNYFGRAWKIKVTPQATGEEWTVSHSSWDTEALRATFSVEQVAMHSYWFADIVIYNFATGMQQIIQKGDRVSIEAGYQSPGSGLIFQGRVWQPLWEREGATDFKLTLHCFTGLFEDEFGYVSTTIRAGASQGEAVRQIAAAAQTPITVDYLDPVLDGKTYPRGITYAGPARKFFNDIALDNNLNIWIGWTGLSIRSLSPQGDVPDRVYAPPLSPASAVTAASALTKYTLIGTPQQTQEGVGFRTLLDSDLKLGALVKLDGATANKIASVPGQRPAFVDKDGLYVVAGIRQSGDTRGNDWYSDITAVTREFSKLQAIILR